MVEEKKYCPFCNVKLIEDEIRCSKCGKSVEDLLFRGKKTEKSDEEIIQPEQQDMIKLFKIIRIIAAVIICICIIGIVVIISTGYISTDWGLVLTIAMAFTISSLVE